MIKSFLKWLGLTLVKACLWIIVTYILLLWYVR